MAATTTSAQICWPSRYWLKWLVLFFGSLFVGVILAIILAKKPEPNKITYIFEGRTTAGDVVPIEYNKNGNWYDVDKDSREGRIPQSQQPKESRQQSEQAYQFRQKGTSFVQNETVIWRTPEEHQQWLKTVFNDRTKSMDPKNYNAEKWAKIIDTYVEHSKNGTMDYPVVFPVTKVK